LVDAASHEDTPKYVCVNQLYPEHVVAATHRKTKAEKIRRVGIFASIFCCVVVVA
jgi:hypothetical protein